MTGAIRDGALEKDHVTEHVDACIIGSGAGGAVVASELARAGWNVLVLEEGGHFTRADFNGRAVEMIGRMYRNGGLMMTVGKPPVLLPLGKTVGGTTTINSGTCFRLPLGIVRSWREEYGLSDLSRSMLDPLFDEVEEVLDVGPIPWEIIGKNALIARRGTEALGWKGDRLRRNANQACHGSGLCCYGCPTDGKRPMHLTYIPRALEAGARIFSHCRAEEILLHQGTATGVVAKFVTRSGKPTGPTLQVSARHVFLCAGAIHSPIFLLGNGLCNSSGQVGRNLTLHPATRVLGLMDEVVDGWRGVPQAYYVDEFADKGITLETIHGPPAIMGPSLPGFGRAFLEKLKDLRRMAVMGVMIHDETRGRVIRAPRGHEVITYHLLARDGKRVVDGCRAAGRVLFAAGAQRVFFPFTAPSEIASVEDLDSPRLAAVRPVDMELMAFHPLGTCRMGPDPARSVVDPWGETHDIRRLYVADGSIFPTSLGVNPQETIMAFAMRTARHVMASDA